MVSIPYFWKLFFVFLSTETLGTIDHVHSDGTVVFRTSPEERGKVILQLGTADAKRALLAAQKV